MQTHLKGLESRPQPSRTAWRYSCCRSMLTSDSADSTASSTKRTATSSSVMAAEPVGGSLRLCSSVAESSYKAAQSRCRSSFLHRFTQHENLGMMEATATACSCTRLSMDRYAQVLIDCLLHLLSEHSCVLVLVQPLIRRRRQRTALFLAKVVDAITACSCTS